MQRSENYCVKCDCSILPSEQDTHKCCFVQYPAPDDDAVTQHWDEAGMLTEYAKAASHAICCTVKYEEETGNEVLPHVMALTELLRELLEETDRRLLKLYRVASNTGKSTGMH